MIELAPPYRGEGPHALWHVSEDPSIARFELGDLVERHASAGIALKAHDDLFALWERVVASTFDFSGIRLRNASMAT